MISLFTPNGRTPDARHYGVCSKRQDLWRFALPLQRQLDKCGPGQDAGKPSVFRASKTPRMLA